MLDKVQRVKTEIIFTFKDGQTYELPLRKYNKDDISTYGTGISLDEKLYEPDSTNFIGNISANTLTIDVTSRDKLFVSSNKKSKYYGLMNDSAVVEIYCTSVEDSNRVYMGRYFVNAWENGTSSSDIYSVTITCINLFGKIKNISLTELSIKRNMTFKEYLVAVVKKLNSQVSSNMQINYRDSDLEIFKSNKEFSDVYFNNIDRSTIETIFNTISQSSISYLWIDRQGYLKGDCLLDDKNEQPVTSLSGLVNLESYEIQDLDITNYSGIKSTYIKSVSYNDSEVLSLSNLQLNKGINTISATLYNTKVINIQRISIEIEEGTGICYTYNYYKDSIKMEIYSSVYTTNATINVYGTVMDEATDTLELYKDTSNKGNLLELENTILKGKYIDTFTEGMLQLISLDNNIVIATGYINPAVNVGDMVSVYGRSLEVDGVYKVISLSFTLGSSYRCTAKLIRTVEIIPSVDSLCYDDNIAVINMINGVNISNYTFEILTDKNEEIVQDKLGSELSSLESYL